MIGMTGSLQEEWTSELRSLRRESPPTDALIVGLEFGLAERAMEDDPVGRAAGWLQKLLRLGCWPVGQLRRLLLQEEIPSVDRLRRLHEERLGDLKNLPAAVVLLPLQNINKEVFSIVVSPSCLWEGLRPVLIDQEEAGAKTWLQKARGQMSSAALFVADVSRNNANVFYEVGFMDGLGKPGTFISLTRTKKPHYINDREISPVSRGIAGIAGSRAKLRAELRSLQNR
jgi:hypothetical protein